MSSYLEYDGKMAFHLGYYIKEIIDERRLGNEIKIERAYKS